MDVSKTYTLFEVIDAMEKHKVGRAGVLEVVYDVKLGVPGALEER